LKLSRRLHVYYEILPADGQRHLVCDIIQVLDPYRKIRPQRRLTCAMTHSTIHNTSNRMAAMAAYRDGVDIEFGQQRRDRIDGIPSQYHGSVRYRNACLISSTCMLGFFLTSLVD
jgi:hypothetical protein